MSSVRAQLDSIVAQYNLLQHPFYQAWSAGTLPKEALATYAAEWGNFVSLVPKGWESCSEHEIAAEEVTHVHLWAGFAASLGTQVAPPTIRQSQELQSVCENCFSDPVEAVGGLFAFEAQQPHTSTSKLDGLQKHYDLGPTGEEYFRIHCDDVHEMEVLAKHAELMSAEDQAKTVLACEKVAKALWDGLTGIHERHCACA